MYIIIYSYKSRFVKIRYGKEPFFKNISEKAERQSYITAILPVDKYEHIRCKLEGNICFRKVKLNMCVCSFL